MENFVTDMKSLEDRLALLRAREKLQLEDFKTSRVYLTESLSPSVLIKNALHRFTDRTPTVNGFTVDTITGIIAGIIGRRLYASKSPGLFRKITAPLLQLVITKFVKEKVTHIREKILPPQEQIPSSF